jgi:hypothetical protein
MLALGGAHTYNPHTGKFDCVFWTIERGARNFPEPLMEHTAFTLPDYRLDARAEVAFPKFKFQIRFPKHSRSLSK